MMYEIPARRIERDARPSNNNNNSTKNFFQKIKIEKEKKRKRNLEKKKEKLTRDYFDDVVRWIVGREKKLLRRAK